MNIFSDRHHQALTYSLYLLLEKRLGHKLFIPIGLEWYTEKFWLVYDHPDTAKQYLMDGYYPKDKTPPLNSVTRIQNGIHYIKDTTHNFEQKAITLEQFKEMDIDVVIASIPAHIPMFKRLISQYKPKAKFIFQQGNMFHEVINNLHEIPNLLSSTIEVPVPGNCNAVFYHQEFEVERFKPKGIKPENKITSFINLLPSTNWGPQFLELKAELPEYEFKSYGILCADGIINGLDEIASIMAKSKWGFHMKWGADGMGHIIHNWAASGKPIIVNYEEYKSRLAGSLLIPDVTCLAADIDGIKKTVGKIRNISDSQYEEMCKNMYNKFLEVVNFNKEEIEIRKWLDKLN